jgi:hypothetical protein
MMDPVVDGSFGKEKREGATLGGKRALMYSVREVVDPPEGGRRAT